MVLSWGILLPLGVLVARYFKIWPGQRWPEQLDHKGWWHSHRALQWSAMAVMTVGTWCAWQATLGNTAGGASSNAFSNSRAIHAVLGWGLVITAWLQIAGSFARGTKGGPTAATLRGDHYDMTARRRLFERIHKTLGWCCVVIACVTIMMGLVLANAPRWMPTIMLSWWCGLGALMWRWQRLGRCVDTYQAIWGADPGLPGLRSPPIGWGVRRRINRARDALIKSA